MFDPTTYLTELMTRYPILGGGAALGIAAALWGSLKSVPGMLYRTLRARMFYTLEVTSDDRPFFQWMDRWAQQYTKFSRSYRPTDGDNSEDAEAEERFHMAPGTGRHFLWTPFGWGWYRQSRENTKSAGAGESYSRTVTVELFAPFRTPKFDQLLLQSYECHLEVQAKERLRVYVPESGDYWQPRMRLRIRPLDSVILPEGMPEAITADVVNFLSNYEWYQDLAVPYRRGYLFHGPPGNGKTSAAMALAHKFRLPLYTLSLSSPGMTDNRLQSLTGDLPERCLLLLEDIDSAFKGRETEGSKSLLSFSGLLNALDGVTTGEGRLLIMTTNLPDQLDPALVRPGRVDRTWEFPNADNSMTARLFARFLPHESAAQCQEFVKSYGNGMSSMAQVQEVLVQRALPSLTPKALPLVNLAASVHKRRRRVRPAWPGRV